MTEEWTVCRESNWPFPTTVPTIPSHSYSLVNFLSSSMVKVSQDFLVKQWMPEHLACCMLCLEIVGGWGMVACIWHINHYLFWKAVLGRTNGSLNAASLAVAAKPQKPHLLQKGQQSAPLTQLAPKYPHILPFSFSRKPKFKKSWLIKCHMHKAKDIKVSISRPCHNRKCVSQHLHWPQKVNHVPLSLALHYKGRQKSH